jgi:hypothetical protein
LVVCRHGAGWAVLLALCLGSAACGASFRSANAVIVKDHQAYRWGSYLAYIAPFNKGALRFGRDYTESIDIAVGRFPNATVFKWDWPDVPCPLGVYGFNAIDYGNYYNTVVSVPIAPRQVGQIHTLRATHNASFMGMLHGYDVIDNFFLTTRAGDHRTNAFEIEVFLHTPAYSVQFVRHSVRVGTFEGSGRRWVVAVARSQAGPIPDILFMPEDEADVAAGTIDLKAMLDYLVGIHLVPATLFFNGMALGVEPQRGSGSMTLNTFSVAYE